MGNYLGRATGFVYDALGRFTAVKDALGQTTSYAYDEAGDLVTHASGSLREAVVPVALLMMTDYYLTVFVYSYAFHVQGYLLTWVWYVAAIVLGSLLLRDKVSVARVGAATVLSATSFFAISNFSVWANAGMYPHNLAGLGACFMAALSFYRNDLLSTGLVLGVAFGLPALLRRFSESEHKAAA